MTAGSFCPLIPQVQMDTLLFEELIDCCSLQVRLLRQVYCLWWSRVCFMRYSAGTEYGSSDVLSFFPLGVRASRFWMYQAQKGSLRHVELLKTSIFASDLGVQITTAVICVPRFCFKTNLVKFGCCCWILLYSGHKQLMDFHWVCHTKKKLYLILQMLHTCM